MHFYTSSSIQRLVAPAHRLARASTRFKFQVTERYGYVERDIML